MRPSASPRLGRSSTTTTRSPCPRSRPSYLKELKERVETAGFVTEEFDALSGQYEVSILKLEAPAAAPHGVRVRPGRARAPRPGQAPGRRGGVRSAPRVQREARRRARLVPRFTDGEAGPLPPVRPYLRGRAAGAGRHVHGFCGYDAAQGYSADALRFLQTAGAARGAGLDARAMDRVEPAPLLPYKADKSGDGPRISTLILLHDHDKRDALHKEWLGNYKIILKPWEQPNNHIRVYLGEQMGFYFLFVSTWATSYLINGMIGLVLYALMKLVPSFNGHGPSTRCPTRCTPAW